MSTLATADGLNLHLWEGPTPPASPRGTVLIVHGLGEHIGRYGHVAARLAASGWRVAGYDQRGHGRSGGPRGAIPAADSLLADLGAVVAHTRARWPGPLVLLGHSMGGVVAGRYVAEGLATRPASWHQTVHALVMTSPALDPGMNPLQHLLLAVAHPLAPDRPLANGLQPEWVSRDPVVVRNYRADALVHDRVTPRLVRFIVDGGKHVRRSARRWATPTLLLFAGADRCVAPQGSLAFVAAAPRAVVQADRYDRMAHEILNEPEQIRVLGDITSWLSELPRVAA